MNNLLPTVDQNKTKLALDKRKATSDKLFLDQVFLAHQQNRVKITFVQFMSSAASGQCIWTCVKTRVFNGKPDRHLHSVVFLWLAGCSSFLFKTRPTCVRLVVHSGGSFRTGLGEGYLADTALR